MLPQWIQSASRTFSDFVEEEITDIDICLQPPKKETLESHFGLLDKKPKPLFHILPLEMKLRIFSFLSPEEMVIISRVCREWERLSKDEKSWRNRFYSEMATWNIYGFHSSHSHPRNSERGMISILPTFDEYDWDEMDKDPSHVSWRNWYIQQYLHNSKFLHSPCSVIKKLSKGKRNNRFFSGRKATPSLLIPVFGQCSSTSALMYNLMWSKESPLRVSGLFPGSEGFGSGVGFRVNKKLLNLVSFYRATQFGTERWDDLFGKSNGFVYLIDSYSSLRQLELAKRELKGALATNRNTPLLILICDETCSLFKRDREEEDQEDFNGEKNKDHEKPENPRTPFELSHYFGTNEYSSRKWCIQTARKVTDICSALEWISSVPKYKP